MRIELPSASWTDALQRLDDDAHTLTLAPEGTTVWSAPLPVTEPGEMLRVQVTAAPAITVTITF